MKKLILFFVAMLVVVAHAEPSYWAAIETTECDYATGHGEADTANYSMYYCTVASADKLFSGSSVDAIETYVKNNFATAKGMAATYDSVAFSDGEYHILDYVGTAYDTSDYVAFAIYGDDAYRVYGDGSATLTPYGELVFNESFAAAGSVGEWKQVVPEPTSALLLLVGLAGIALKRKR